MNKKEIIELVTSQLATTYETCPYTMTERDLNMIAYGAVSILNVFVLDDPGKATDIMNTIMDRIPTIMKSVDDKKASARYPTKSACLTPADIPSLF